MILDNSIEQKDRASRPTIRWKRKLLQIALMGIMFMYALSFISERPENLGTLGGKLRPCPSSPNCVSTTAEDKAQRMAPISFEGTVDQAMQRLLAVVTSMPRTRVISQTDNYLYVEFKSMIFRFVDDVEFLIDGENNKIDFRSASRVGYSDMGANRKRMKTISERFRNE